MPCQLTYQESISFLVQLLFFLELKTALFCHLFRFFLIQLRILFIGSFFSFLLLEIVFSNFRFSVCFGVPPFTWKTFLPGLVVLENSFTLRGGYKKWIGALCAQVGLVSCFGNCTGRGRGGPQAFSYLWVLLFLGVFPFL